MNTLKIWNRYLLLAWCLLCVCTCQSFDSWKSRSDSSKNEKLRIKREAGSTYRTYSFGVNNINTQNATFNTRYSATVQQNYIYSFSYTEIINLVSISKNTPLFIFDAKYPGKCLNYLTSHWQMKWHDSQVRCMVWKIWSSILGLRSPGSVLPHCGTWWAVPWPMADQTWQSIV